ncbi:hemerythrin domain-containing protein [Paenibacillus sp. y28]|uniref:hemerythrin domain-containing protein n=1 Tax=Paenibacillus sp. y28 TaxID=3129110 RepID=UPI0030198BB9
MDQMQLQLKMQEGTSVSIGFLTNRLQRYLRDHADLREAISYIEDIMKQMCSLGAPEAAPMLGELKAAALGFVAKLEEHSDWEDGEFFPMVNRCFDIPSRPVLMTSLWMLEKEHELTKTFLDGYFELADSCWTGTALLWDVFERAKDQLLHACRLVKEHLELEEGILLPLAEEVVSIEAWEPQ